MKFASSVDAAARRRRAVRVATFAAALVCAGLAIGCGQKGPLSLPKASAPAGAPATPASGATR
jgi:predicted small lipoprotein YifL